MSVTFKTCTRSKLDYNKDHCDHIVQDIWRDGRCHYRQCDSSKGHDLKPHIGEKTYEQLLLDTRFNSLYQTDINNEDMESRLSILKDDDFLTFQTQSWKQTGASFSDSDTFTQSANRTLDQLEKDIDKVHEMLDRLHH